MEEERKGSIPSGVNLCRACGDPVLNALHCKECRDELQHGIIRPPRPPKHTLGSGNTEPWKHDSAYHGSQTNGEW